MVHHLLTRSLCDWFKSMSVISNTVTKVHQDKLMFTRSLKLHMPEDTCQPCLDRTLSFSSNFDYPYLNMVDTRCEIIENTCIGLWPTSWHRTPETLLISWVIRTSFVLALGLWPQFLTQCLKPLSFSGWWESLLFWWGDARWAPGREPSLEKTSPD